MAKMELFSWVSGSSPLAPIATTGPNATAPKTAEPPARRGGTRPGAPAADHLTTHGEQTAGTQDRAAGRLRRPRGAPAFAHVAA
jgi:hypothetical protein